MGKKANSHGRKYNCSEGILPKQFTDWQNACLGQWVRRVEPFKMSALSPVVKLSAPPIWILCLFVKNKDGPCYARPIYGKDALALGQFQLVRSFHIHDREGRKWLSASRSFKSMRQVSNYKDAEEQEFSHSI